MDGCFVPSVLAAKGTAGYVDDFQFHCRTKVFASKVILGSAYVEMNGSKVVAKVLSNKSHGKGLAGPLLDLGVLDCEVSFANYLPECERGEETVDCLQRAVSGSLTPSVLLQLYPKQVITLSIVVIETSPNDICAALNAGSLALADAGVATRDLCVSSRYELDTSKGPDSVASITVSTLTKLRTTTGLIVEGRLTPEQLAHDLACALERSRRIKDVMVGHLVTSCKHQK